MRDNQKIAMFILDVPNVVISGDIVHACRGVYPENRLEFLGGLIVPEILV